MCGRFTLRTPANILVEQFRLEAVPDLAPRYNIAPTQDVAVVRPQAEAADRRELVLMHWGLVPSWSKDPRQGARMINARCETVAEKPAFRAAFKRRRCLVVADGYYEWQKTTRHKQPYFIHRRDDQLFAFAGLWERWRGDDAVAALESCTIITTDAASQTRDIHDRMPVILDAADYDLWLDPEFQDKAKLTAMLAPLESDELIAQPVSTYVNNVRNTGPECVRVEEGG